MNTVRSLAMTAALAMPVDAMADHCEELSSQANCVEVQVPHGVRMPTSNFEGLTASQRSRLIDSQARNWAFMNLVTIPSVRQGLHDVSVQDGTENVQVCADYQTHDECPGLVSFGEYVHYEVKPENGYWMRLELAFPHLVEPVDGGYQFWAMPSDQECKDAAGTQLITVTALSADSQVLATGYLGADEDVHCEDGSLEIAIGPFQVRLAMLIEKIVQEATAAQIATQQVVQPTEGK